MTAWLQSGIQILGVLSSVAWFGFAWLSAREREWRAARRALVIAVLSGQSLILLAQLPPPGVHIIAALMAGGAVLVAAALLLPAAAVLEPEGEIRVRVDERDMVFARHDLQPGSPAYEAYYHLHPEKQAGDDHTRALPGLLSPASRRADALAFAAARGSFFLTEAVKDAVDGPLAPEQHKLPAEVYSRYVKQLVRHSGAHAVGICRLEPYPVYSHAGRGTDPIGEPLPVKHRFAIAFTVGMDYAMMASAPDAPVVMESARQYVEAARIAVQLAAFCRGLGYPARAHIDANYQVIAPLVARDAGLGAIGRMGLLMTPRLGPRVRIGVVTTDLPLLPDPKMDDGWMMDFCRLCEKCAENCPSRAIPSGPRLRFDGALRWKLDAERCFAYWNIEGTDCGICMKVCPFSHPDQWVHNAVRWLIRRAPRSRRVVLAMDDFFYGRRPASRPAPAWTQVDELEAGNRSGPSIDHAGRRGRTAAP